MMLYFFMLPTSLVRMENGFCEASCLEQREAQNNRVRCHREQSRVNVVCDDHAVDQHRIDADTDHDEKALKCQSEQAFQIVRADAAPFAVAHGCDGNRRNAHGAVNLNHAPVENDRNEDRHDFEAQADQERFYRQSEQFSDAHVLHAGTHLRNRRVNVNARVAVDDSCCAGNHVLPDVEYCHHDVKRMRHEVDRHSRLEKPLEEHPSVHVVKVVFLGDHGNQLVAQNEGDDDTSDGDYHVFG